MLQILLFFVFCLFVENETDRIGTPTDQEESSERPGTSTASDEIHEYFICSRKCLSTQPKACETGDCCDGHLESRQEQEAKDGGESIYRNQEGSNRKKTTNRERLPETSMPLTFLH